MWHKSRAWSNFKDFDTSGPLWHFEYFYFSNSTDCSRSKAAITGRMCFGLWSGPQNYGAWERTWEQSQTGMVIADSSPLHNDTLIHTDIQPDFTSQLSTTVSTRDSQQRRSRANNPCECVDSKRATIHKTHAFSDGQQLNSRLQYDYTIFTNVIFI